MACGHPAYFLDREGVPGGFLPDSIGKWYNSKARVEQVASSKVQTIKLGLDVHADSIVVVRIVDHSAPQPAQKFTPAKFREWVKGQLRLAEAVHSSYEAGPFGYGLHRDLVKLGIRNLVVQPVCLDERHKGVNRSPRGEQG